MKITRKSLFGMMLTFPFLSCIVWTLYRLIMQAIAGDGGAIFLTGIFIFTAISFLFAKGMEMIMEERDE